MLIQERISGQKLFKMYVDSAQLCIKCVVCFKFHFRAMLLTDRDQNISEEDGINDILIKSGKQKRPFKIYKTLFSFDILSNPTKEVWSYVFVFFAVAVF